MSKTVYKWKVDRYTKHGQNIDHVILDALILMNPTAIKDAAAQGYSFSIQLYKRRSYCRQHINAQSFVLPDCFPDGSEVLEEHKKELLDFKRHCVYILK